MADKRLLAVIVEDMTDLVLLLARELSRYGWDAEKFTALAPALVRVKTYPYPDLVLLDLNLPDSPPEQTVRCITEIMKYAPVMVISGCASPELVDQIKLTGALFQTKLGGEPRTFLARIVESLALYRTRHLKAAEDNIALLRESLSTYGR